MAFVFDYRVGDSATEGDFGEVAAVKKLERIGCIQGTSPACVANETAMGSVVPFFKLPNGGEFFSYRKGEPDKDGREAAGASFDEWNKDLIVPGEQRVAVIGVYTNKYEWNYGK